MRAVAVFPRVLAAAAAASVLSAPGSARAEVEAGLTFGPHLFSKDTELGVPDVGGVPSPRNSVLFGLRLGVTFGPVLGVEAEVGVIPTESRRATVDVWALTYRLHLLAQFRAADPGNRLLPFVVVGAGALTVIDSGDDPATGIAEDTDELPYLGVGARLRVDGGWGLRGDARLLLPPSTESEYGTVDGELLLSVYRQWGGPAKRAAEPPPPPPPPPPPDTDGDGLLDEVDQCDEAPEDADGFEDADGCPDPDDDGDGVLDDADQCDREPEDADGVDDVDGCPDPDNDGDGLLDAADRCPLDPEDPDGYEDEDGCPDGDNDGDGVGDATDACPDGRSNPAHVETRNGFRDDDGCADELPKAIKKFTGVIKGINFKTNSAEILASSNPVLDAAAAVLLEYAELRLEIQGHTDDVGDRAYNVDLSQRRAESVRAYLAAKGVAEARLTARGFGPDAPIAKGRSKSARAANRRVEFRLVSGLEEPAP